MHETHQLGEFEQVVLLAILRLEENAYGVTIREEINFCTGREISPGALYTTLERLSQKNFLATRTGGATAERGGRAKRFYTVTREGKQAVASAQKQFQALLKGLNLLGERNG